MSKENLPAATDAARGGGRDIKASTGCAENPAGRGALSELLEHRMSRRQFLFIGAATVATVTLSNLVPDTLFQAEVAAYEGVKIGSLRSLPLAQPQEFRYPWDDANCISYLIKLGVPAGGGVGPDKDVVAFNAICPHMGFPLLGQFKGEHQVMGPCPSHLSTYDLTRHGMVVAGHATEGLPQVMLETRGDDIYAVGVLGLIYGFSNNEAAPV